MTRDAMDRWYFAHIGALPQPSPAVSGPVVAEQPAACESWCGKDGREAPESAKGWSRCVRIELLYCREACLDAGRPLNPAKEPA